MVTRNLTGKTLALGYEALSSPHSDFHPRDDTQLDVYAKKDPEHKFRISDCRQSPVDSLFYENTPTIHRI
ncbi:hypothetical protein ABNF65_17610, partial [Paenibacillus larvae]